MEQYLGTDELPKNDLITYLQKNADSAFLRHWKLTGTNKSIRKNRNCSQLIAAYKVYVCIQTFSVMNGCVLCFAALKILVEEGYDMDRKVECSYANIKFSFCCSLCFFPLMSSVKCAFVLKCIWTMIWTIHNLTKCWVTILIFQIINLECAVLQIVTHAVFILNNSFFTGFLWTWIKIRIKSRGHFYSSKFWYP